MDENDSNQGNRHYQLLKEFNDGIWKNTPDLQKKMRMNENNLRKILQTFVNKKLIKKLHDLPQKEQKEITSKHIMRDVRSNENYYQITEKGKQTLLKFEDACISLDSKEIFNFGLKWK